MLVAMNNQNRVALLAGIAAAIIAGAILAQPSISALAASHNATNSTSDDSELTTFEEQAMNAESNDTTSTIDNMTDMAHETDIAVTTGENETIVIQGTASSPGVEGGPFQIIDLLPPSLDGNIYVGWVSFTASKPVLVAPLQTYGVANETLDPEFGQLFVFPGIPNSTMIAPAITMPD